MFTSYAQNFEDVLLWRALKHIDKGFYIDIGAQDPVVDSVSLTFYEHGWRGVHVEPTPTYAQALRDARPDETVVQAAVGDEGVLIPFFEIPRTGISTGDAAIARRHEESGFACKRIDVPCIRLATILDRYQALEIHWMKVDVEGMEHSVLRSWAPSTVRPWILVVEATLPLSQEASHSTWESLVIGLGYRFVHFDGLNRFYVSGKHPNLLSAFATPPNVFDEFALSGTGSHAFCVRLKETLARAQSEIGELKIHRTQLENELRAAHEDDRLTRALDEVRTKTELAERAWAQLREEQVLNGQLIEVNRSQHERAMSALAEREEQWARATDALDAALRRQESLTAQRESELNANSEAYLARESRLRHELEDVTADRQLLEGRVERANDDMAELRRQVNETLSDASTQHAALQAELSTVRQRILETKVANASLEAELAGVYRSWTWRLFHGRRTGADSIPRKEHSPAGSHTMAPPPSSSTLDSEIPMTSSSDNPRKENDMMISYDPTPPEPSVSYLLTLFDVAFVRAAYAIVLGREADSGGLNNHLLKLRAGTSREDILVAIATSAEGRLKGLNVEGLNTLVGRTHNRTRRLLRRTLGGKSEALARQMRSLENRLAANGTEVAMRFGRLETALRRVEGAIGGLRDLADVGSLHARHPQTNGNEAKDVHSHRPDGHTRLQEQLFSKLKSELRK